MSGSNDIPFEGGVPFGDETLADKPQPTIFTVRQSEKSLESLPATMQWLRSINAKPAGFLHAVIETAGFGRYRHITHKIIFARGSGDITIQPRDKKLLPSKDAAKIIAAEFEHYAPPGQVMPHRGHTVPAFFSSRKPENLYIFENDENRIEMIVERVDHENGTKNYYPWTLWEDGQWRRMEPEGLLPLWGIKDVTEGDTVFIHEGPKAARHCRELVERGADHPFIDILRSGVHIGWHGGALNPARANWESLNKKKPAKVYIIADNDQPGIDGALGVSRWIRARVEIVRWGASYPPGWDMADPAPSNVKGGWPQFNRHCLSGTVPFTLSYTVNEDGEEVMIETPNILFREDWKFVTGQGVFVPLERPGLSLKPENFDAMFRWSSAKKDLYKHVQKIPDILVDTLDYMPLSAPTGIREENNRSVSFVNMWVPPGIAAKEGDVTPFIDFMNRSIPDPLEREWTLKKLATVVRYPNRRVPIALYAASVEQGTGKTTLFEAIMRPLVGEANSYVADMNDLDGGPWTYHLTGKTYVVFTEFETGKLSRFSFHNHMKSIISDRTINSKRKFRDPIEMNNFANICLVTNRRDIIPAEESERRWVFVHFTEERMGEGEAKALYHWLHEEDGLEKINWWMRNQPEDWYLNEKSKAPVTVTAEESRESTLDMGGWQPMANRMLNMVGNVRFAEGLEALGEPVAVVGPNGTVKTDLPICVDIGKFIREIRLKFPDGKGITNLHLSLAMKKAGLTKWDTRVAVKNGGTVTFYVNEPGRRLLSMPLREQNQWLQRIIETGDRHVLRVIGPRPELFGGSGPGTGYGQARLKDFSHGGFEPRLLASLRINIADLMVSASPDEDIA